MAEDQIETYRERTFRLGAAERIREREEAVAFVNERGFVFSLDTLPYFYALSENYGEPEKDYLQLYTDGLLSRESKIIYETILREGPLDTVRLRRKTQMTRRKLDSMTEAGTLTKIAGETPSKTIYIWHEISDGLPTTSGAHR